MAAAGRGDGAGSFYSADLAAVHDAGFTALARGAARVLLDALARRGIRTGLVVDLGCGSGVLAAAAAAAGYDVLGVDLSPAMVALARRRVPGGRFRVGDTARAELPPCVAVAAVGEVLSYRGAGRRTRADLRALLARLHRALAPGGVLLLDVACPGRVPGPGPSRYGAAGDGWAVVSVAEEDRRRRLLSRRIACFRRAGTGAGWRRSDETHLLRLFPAGEVQADLERAGFRARRLRGYGDARFPAGYAGFLATKPRRPRPSRIRRPPAAL